ncbi:hypothetical protein AB6A40_008691 [Gnathostoma spinigerum]|uniref:Integrase catalytic domain-containing protein n=1 Tax=Gnathostoma spinigerum TaxID=75299 RepID=A0ABD6EZB3_9BILA
MNMHPLSDVKQFGVLFQLFARCGMPEIIVSANGTRFVSAELEEFYDTNGISHFFSALYHPQSNGQAERFLDTLKRSLHKLKEER